MEEYDPRRPPSEAVCRSRTSRSGIALVVGRADAAAMQVAGTCGTSIVVCPFGNLNAAMLRAVEPACIVAPLMAPGFDAAQVVVRLNLLEFGGLVCVVSPRLPDRRMVEAELNALAPNIKVTLFEAGSD